MVVTCSLPGSTEATPEQDEETPKAATPTLVPSPEPEQAPGTAVTELPDVDPPAACEQRTSAPLEPVVLDPGPQRVLAATTERAPSPHFY